MGCPEGIEPSLAAPQAAVLTVTPWAPRRDFAMRNPRGTPFIK